MYILCEHGRNLLEDNSSSFHNLRLARTRSMLLIGFTAAPGQTNMFLLGAFKKVRGGHRKGHRRWSSYACVIVFGLFVYILLQYVLPFSTKRMFIRWTHPTPNSTVLRNSSLTKVGLQTNTNRSNIPVLNVTRYTISYPYQKHWIGFPEFSNIDCPKPLNYPTLNRMFPSDVQRTFPADFLQDTQNCKYFIAKYGYARHPPALQEELDFPIAFALLFHRDLDQVHLLLRAIYRPHNVYCLSVDTKSSVEFLEATRSIAQCLPNVFVSSKLENVVYAGYTRLMADMNCFKDLVGHSVAWKYVINVPGQAFALRTNLEMVRILKLFNGTNDIEAKTGSQREEDRFLTKWEYITNGSSGEVSLKKTTELYPSPPSGLEIVKCSAYGAFTRAFVEFLFTNQMAQDLLAWARSVFSPDELYWATLNYNSVEPAPGGFSGVPNKTPWLTSFSVWEQDHYTTCVSKFVRGVCIFSPGDLPMLIKQHELFANKLHITHEPVALHCLDQFIYNLTFSRTVRDLEFYKSLDLTHRRGTKR